MVDILLGFCASLRQVPVVQLFKVSSYAAVVQFNWIMGGVQSYEVSSHVRCLVMGGIQLYIGGVQLCEVPSHVRCPVMWGVQLCEVSS